MPHANTSLTTKTKTKRYAKFLGILTLESFSASALGLAVGAVAPSAEAAVAIGPAVILVHIVFGGLYVNVRGLRPLLGCRGESVFCGDFGERGGCT
jgi:hypothetical protein